MRHVPSFLTGLIFVLHAGFAVATVRGAELRRAACADALANAGYAADAGAAVVSSTAALGSTKPEPSLFRNLDHARGRVRSLRRYLVKHLTPGEITEIYQTLKTPGVATHADSPAVLGVTRIYERARSNFISELNADSPVLHKALGVRLDRAIKRGDQVSSYHLRRLADQLAMCRQSLSFEACAEVWARVRKEVNFKIPRAVPVDPAPEAGDDAFVDADATPVPRPTDEVAELDLLGGTDQKTKMRRAFERTFRSEGAISREARRDQEEIDGVGRRHEYTFVPDLNIALGFLIGEPVVSERPSKVILTAPALVNGSVVDVDVVFDPRNRYVTVQVPGGTNAARFYYRLRNDADGRLVITDDPTLEKSEVGFHLSDTHFAY